MPVGLVGAEAARALGEIGPDAKAAVKYLEERAETDLAKQVRDAAQEALRKINAER
jgi:HEAT repeat protein